MSVVKLAEYRARRKDRQKSGGAPHLSLHLWIDPEDGEIVCSQLEGKDSHASIITGIDRDNVVTLLMIGASRTGSMLHEDKGVEDAWMSEPVILSKITRRGFAVTQPNKFWHDEAAQGLWTRLRCARWALGMAASVMMVAVRNCATLVFNPKRMREWEIE